MSGSTSTSPTAVLKTTVTAVYLTGNAQWFHQVTFLHGSCYYDAASVFQRQTERLVLIFFVAGCAYLRESSFGTTNSGLINNPTSNMAAASDFERQFLRVLNKVYQHIERSEARLADQDRKDVIKVEWQQVALVIDRLDIYLSIIQINIKKFSLTMTSFSFNCFTKVSSLDFHRFNCCRHIWYSLYVPSFETLYHVLIK